MTPEMRAAHYPLFLEWLQEQYPEMYVQYGNDISLPEEDQMLRPIFHCSSVEARERMEQIVRKYREMINV